MDTQAPTANNNVKPSAGIIQWLKFVIACAMFIVPLGYLEVAIGSSISTHMGNMYHDCKFVTSEQVQSCRRGVELSMIGVNLTIFLLDAATIALILLTMAQNCLHMFDDAATYKRLRRTFWIAALTGLTGVIYFAL